MAGDIFGGLSEREATTQLARNQQLQMQAQRQFGAASIRRLLADSAWDFAKLPHHYVRLHRLAGGPWTALVRITISCMKKQIHAPHTGLLGFRSATLF
jgi:hypothetical protein